MFFEYSFNLPRKKKSQTFKDVQLYARGQEKFKLDGAYFKQLGDEYSWQNPVYTIRTFPSHVMNPDGNPAYSDWQGGILAVTTQQLDDFNDFSDKWYGNIAAGP